MSSEEVASQEFHYQYDSAGRLTHAAFAQTSQGTGYGDLAERRARASYLYTPAGSLKQLAHWWDTLNHQTQLYASTPILASEYDYDQTKMLRTDARFCENSSNVWSLYAKQSYSYDSQLDYLTQAKYDDNGDNTWDQTDNWTYDAAGNRNDASVVDNLNRATTIGGVARTYDILGNTLSKGSTTTYTWDETSRMLSHTGGQGTHSYLYRADGMRKQKSKSPAGQADSFYFYDGQMCVEERFEGTSYPRDYIQSIRYGLGARGIDYIERARTLSGTLVGFPIYDGHGNMIATLMRSGSSYSLGDQRLYDAWGSVRGGSTTGEPNPRYVANLGHLSDDESGLIYMRARYYEPSSGRFISEDRAADGWNWYVYARNNPIRFIDYSGCNALVVNAILFGLGFAVGIWVGKEAGDWVVNNWLPSYMRASGSSASAAEMAIDLYNTKIAEFIRHGLRAVLGFALEAIGVTKGAAFVQGLSRSGAFGLGFVVGVFVSFVTSVLQGIILQLIADIYTELT